jgi:hypothetical protein
MTLTSHAVIVSMTPTCLTGANDTNEACLSSITDKNEFASSASINPKMIINFTRVIVNDIVTWKDMLCRCRCLWQDSNRNLNNLPLPLTGQPVKNQTQNTCDFPIVCIHFKKKSLWKYHFFLPVSLVQRSNKSFKYRIGFSKKLKWWSCNNQGEMRNGLVNKFHCQNHVVL